VGEPAILTRFPALRSLPRVSLGSPTAVERATLPDGRSLLLKRDDRFGGPVAGNKVRGLEWLLGPVRPGEHVLTVGPRGSTHALATATYAGSIGANTTIVRWNQTMNAAARRVDERMRSCARTMDLRFVAPAYALATALRLGHRVHWIPAGGATPLAIVGHVSAALELVDQIARGECERPDRVIVPLGSGGTAAGLWLGFAIAAASIDVVGVRVVPRIVGRRGRVRALARSTARLIRQLSGAVIPEPEANRFRIEHGFFGGGYGHPLAGTSIDIGNGVRTDDTYSGKALRAAAAATDGRTLLWLTFDGRLLQD
jgi:D-cysteine desulfhydrase